MVIPVFKGRQQYQTITIVDDDGPLVFIDGGEPVNEGQDAVFTVRTNEPDNSRTEDIVVNLIASENSSSFISGTPDATVDYTRWFDLHNLSGSND